MKPEPITQKEILQVLYELGKRLRAPDAAKTWKAIHETDESANMETLTYFAMLAIRFNRKPVEGDIYK